MRLRRDFLVGVGILVGLNLILAFGTIGLLTRMGPAIREILEENVYSIEACESMLSVLVGCNRPEGCGEDARLVFAYALRRARQNVTEAEEIPVLEGIEKAQKAALSGDAVQIAEIKKALLLLSEINRRAMTKADQEAQRLGDAGAWAAAFLALVSLLLSLVVISRLEQKLLRPLLELEDVLKAARTGDPQRRCFLAGVPLEIRRVFESLNAVLDRASETRKRMETEAEASALERLALLHALGSYGRPAVLVDRAGEVVASNQEAILALSDPEGPAFRTAVYELAELGRPPDSLDAIPIAEAGWICIQKRSDRRGDQSK